jgi:hypothetical protein
MIVKKKIPFPILCTKQDNILLYIVYEHCKSIIPIWIEKRIMKNEKTSGLKNKISDALIIFLFRQFILIHGYLFTKLFFLFNIIFPKVLGTGKNDVRFSVNQSKS